MSKNTTILCHTPRLLLAQANKMVLEELHRGSCQGTAQGVQPKSTMKPKGHGGVSDLGGMQREESSPAPILASLPDP